MNKKRVVSIDISIGKYQDFLKRFLSLSSEKKSSYVCVANVHMTVEAYLDKDFCSIVNNAEIVTPDGMPLAKAIKFIYGISQDRVAGMDLIGDLFEECEKYEKSIFIYGSTSDTLEKLKIKTSNDFSNLLLNTYAPPYRQLSKEEKDNDIKMINDLNPDFVFVALGCPKQERWMAEHKDKVNSCMIGLGGAVEVYAGVKDRAPLWMQKYSLEWLYRFIQEPKRLWKRYFVTNSLFIILFLKQYIIQKTLKKK